MGCELQDEANSCGHRSILSSLRRPVSPKILINLLPSEPGIESVETFQDFCQPDAPSLTWAVTDRLCSSLSCRSRRSHPSTFRYRSSCLSGTLGQLWTSLLQACRRSDGLLREDIVQDKGAVPSRTTPFAGVRLYTVQWDAKTWDLDV